VQLTISRSAARSISTSYEAEPVTIALKKLLPWPVTRTRPSRQAASPFRHASAATRGASVLDKSIAVTYHFRACRLSRGAGRGAQVLGEPTKRSFMKMKGAFRCA
jgi:hypothetical protein